MLAKRQSRYREPATAPVPPRRIYRPPFPPQESVLRKVAVVLTWPMIMGKGQYRVPATQKPAEKGDRTMSATTVERVEVARDILVKVAEREAFRTEACPYMRGEPEDHTKALKAALACTKEIGQVLAEYRTLTPAFKDWDDIEVIAALSMVASFFSGRASFRDSEDFAALTDYPAQVVDLLESFRTGRLHDYACLVWGARHWDIQVTQPDALVAMVVGD